jgi:hypothetical protein
MLRQKAVAVGPISALPKGERNEDKNLEGAGSLERDKPTSDAL